MATYDAINRDDAYALIAEDITTEIIKSAIAESAVLTQFRRLPDMFTRDRSMPVINALPMTGFVNGDGGRKSVTQVTWDKVYLRAEEIATIIVIPEAVYDDALGSGYDIWTEVLPLVGQDFGRVIDSAILFGVDKPVDWRDSIYDAATAAGNTVSATTSKFADIMGEDGVISLVEQSGFEPNGAISGIRVKGSLRGITDTSGNPIFMSSMQDPAQYMLAGMPIKFLTNGAWDDDKALMIVGDMNQAVYAIRQEITYKVLTEGVIQDNTGGIVHNLTQEDKIGLRIVMRLGWALPNPINALKPDHASRFPFAVYVP